MPNISPIHKNRIDQVAELRESLPSTADTWFIHTALAQCFLPYRDPKTDRWQRENGKCSIMLVAGDIKDSRNPNGYRTVGLPYGAKPRLFQSYACTQAIKQQSPVIPVERSMTAMMHELGLKATGGKEGTISRFKDQITRFARCRYTIIAPGERGSERYIEATPVRRMDVWFPSEPNQQTLWPSEIVLSDDYYYSLKDHAIPFDFRGMKTIQHNARAQDIYLWMTQRLCRIPKNKPLFMTWSMLQEMFGGNMAKGSDRMFPKRFKESVRAAYVAYPDARMQEDKEGFRFYHSAPPIPKTKIVNKKI